MLSVSARNDGQSSLDGDTSDGSKRLQLSDSFGEHSLDALDKRGKLTDKSVLASPETKMSKRESLKEKKKSYRSQKKEVAREIMNSASDQSFVLMADWLKVRGTLKGWTKLWCVCKPAMLIIYKSEKMKTGHWVGTILLNTCQLLQRPSKKEGFCFKLFHPLDQSIWATKGPKGETIGAFVQPLPMSYLIFRAPSENQGKCWMDGLELALRCTSLIKRTTSKPNDLTDLPAALSPTLHSPLTPELTSSMLDDPEDNAEEAEDVEHFSEDDDHSSMEMSESDFELAEGENNPQDVPKVEETVYVANEVEELGQQGDACQTEEVNEENKGLIWTLVKQVRPGMDLSKVVLPTFILEPRSFLDKLTDYYYHADILSQAVQQETALERMKHVVKWYLSGFYKKPKGLKKPYNPIIGETFRCYWVHPETKSRTFYVAEQISHHPPVSAFHVTNRQDGFNISACILAKSKFYGNSISAILDGVATLTFLERGEDYLITMPYAHCKGILLGTLTMEMGGKVSLDCPKTGYHCDLDFKLKPFFGNGESANRITGRIRMGSEVLCTFEGHWDQQIFIKELTNREKVVFWDPSLEIRSKRLVRHTVPLDGQQDNESERLWKKVSEAVQLSDMHAATSEKHRLEEKQRSEAKERHKTKTEWVPNLFTLDNASNKWIYKHVDGRPWDSMTDCIQYEKEYVIQTQTVHTIPQVWKGPTHHHNHTTSRLKAYAANVVVDSEDSMSSDGNLAAPEDTPLCRNTNRASSRSETLSCELSKDKPGLNTTPKKTPVVDASRRVPRTNVLDVNGFEAKKSSGGDVTPKLLHHSDFAAGKLDSPSRKAIAELAEASSLMKRSNQTPVKAFILSQELRDGSASPSAVSPNISRKNSPTASHHPPRVSSRDSQLLHQTLELQQEMQKVLTDLANRMGSLHKGQTELSSSHSQQMQLLHQQREAQLAAGDGLGMQARDWVLVAVLLIFQTLVQFCLTR